MKIENIKPWESFCFGFEYGHDREPACLETIVSLLRGAELGAKMPDVSMYEEFYFKDGKTDTSYELVQDMWQSVSDGGHHRILASRIGKYEIGVKAFDDEDELMDEGKCFADKGGVEFGKMHIASSIANFKYRVSCNGYCEVPEGLVLPNKVPGPKAVSEFFVANKDVKVSSDMILQELYGVS